MSKSSNRRCVIIPRNEIFALANSIYRHLGKYVSDQYNKVSNKYILKNLAETYDINKKKYDFSKIDASVADKLEAHGIINYDSFLPKQQDYEEAEETIKYFENQIVIKKLEGTFDNDGYIQNLNHCLTSDTLVIDIKTHGKPDHHSLDLPADSESTEGMANITYYMGMIASAKYSHMMGLHRQKMKEFFMAHSNTGYIGVVGRNVTLKNVKVVDRVHITSKNIDLIIGEYAGKIVKFFCGTPKLKEQTKNVKIGDKIELTGKVKSHCKNKYNDSQETHLNYVKIKNIVDNDIVDDQS